MEVNLNSTHQYIGFLSVKSYKFAVIKLEITNLLFKTIQNTNLCVEIIFTLTFLMPTLTFVIENSFVATL